MTSSSRARNEAFGSRVRAAMAVSRIPAAQIAADCGVTVQAVQRWRDGSALPSSMNLLRLSQITGASLEWLMWPHHLDMRSTLLAPDGVHAKALIRAVIEDMASEGVLRVAACTCDAA